ncbi:uncharacterized protein PAC_14571 [Phialocephala subalpina]|uniref:Uncharacterized protein n=1 Tax=Phialocephala subalpina TaxID=576137 RepID=A0A1L7XI02_9HELO|nr:uncharacterized protein PAC_14571 [Phialocephala subalpina]
MFNTLPRRAISRSRSSLKKSREQREYERLQKSQSHQNLRSYSNHNKPPCSYNSFPNQASHPLSPTQMGEVSSPLAITLEKLENKYQVPKGEEQFSVRRDVRFEVGTEEEEVRRSRSRTVKGLQAIETRGLGGREREFVARKPLATNTTISIRVQKEEPENSKKLVEDLISENERLRQELQRLKMSQQEQKSSPQPREALGSHPTSAHPLSQPPMQARQQTWEARGLPEYQAPQIQTQYFDKDGERRVVIPPPKRDGAVRGFCDRSFGGVMKFLGML